MNRVLMLACAVAATALVTVDANAAGRARGGCGCSQPTAMPVYAAPQSAARCCASTGVPHGVAGEAMPGMMVPTTPAAPAVGGHQHHSAAPTDSATLAVSTEKPGASCCGKDKAAALVSADEPKTTEKVADKGNGEDYHDGLCDGGKKEGAKVTGTVAEKDGKKWVKATKIEEKK